MFKKFLFASLMIAISFIANAQSIQKPFLGRTWLKPPAELQMRSLSALAISSIKSDTTFYQIKPIGGLAYSFPNNVAQAIGGFSYQHIKYKYQTATAPDESYCDYSFNVLYSLGVTSTTKLIDESSSSFGVGIGVLNNKIVVCFLLNSYKDKTDPNDKQRLKPVAAIMYSF